MGDVKILHNYTLDEVKDGKLNIYFPHNLDISKNPEIYRLKFWIEQSGMKYKEVSEDRTNILYPNSFNLSDCFYERNQFKYVIGLKKIKDIKMDINDFFVFLYSKFLKKSKTCDKLLTYVVDISQIDYESNSLRYFNHINYSFENIPDENVFINDLNENVEFLDYVKSKFLRGNRESSVVYLKSFKEKSKKKKESQIKYLNLPELKIKGLESEYMHDLINLLNEHYGFNNRFVYYNAFIGMIFSQDLTKKEVNVDVSDKNFVKNSSGLYITKTYLKLKEYGFLTNFKDSFNSNILEYLRSKSVWYLNPTFLYEGIYRHSKEINLILENEDFNVNSDDNIKIFLTGMMEDLVLGIKMLGMFLVDEMEIEL